MSIDFSKAPDGATHYMLTSAGVNWYCGQGRTSMLWDQGEWVISYASMEAPLVLPIPSAKQPSGSKHDSGKPVMGAVPPHALLAVARVLTFGAEKYGRDNWQKVENMEVRYFDATLRHINAHQRGEKVDPESGESHLAHAVCSLMFMLETQERKLAEANALLDEFAHLSGAEKAAAIAKRVIENEVKRQQYIARRTPTPTDDEFMVAELVRAGEAAIVEEREKIMVQLRAKSK